MTTDTGLHRLEDGTLELTFEDGTVLQVPPHSYYEAWIIEGPGQHLAVCAPGGKVVVWDDPTLS